MRYLVFFFDLRDLADSSCMLFLTRERCFKERVHNVDCQVRTKHAAAERGESPAERKKAEEKEIANNPANLIREAMDKADDALLDTIEKKREKPV